MAIPTLERSTSPSKAALLVALVVGPALYAQQPDRPVPPPGIAVPDNDRKELDAGLARLTESIQSLGKNALVADVQIFRDAVRYALAYDEFFVPLDLGKAKVLLAEGQKRADQLQRGELPGRPRPDSWCAGMSPRSTARCNPTGS